MFAAGEHDITTWVAALVDEGTVACVNEGYESPAFSQFERLANELEDDSSVELECTDSGAFNELSCKDTL